VKLVNGQHTPDDVSGKICGLVIAPPNLRLWWLCLSMASLGVLIFIVSVTVLLIEGVGVWGVMIPVGWGLAITNFVWWIGIGHAGTLISAILLLVKQEWRTSINRFAEAMTLFAVVCAGMFPLLHLGRPWYAYWLIPYPSKLYLWPQWRSPLIWDFFAVSTYASVSLMFWYLGLVPDLATMRDRAEGIWRRRIYGFFALGWRNSGRSWIVHQRAYFLMASLAAPLVLSVHSIVSLDFAVGIVPGWHSTIFPPYFVAGAIFSGFAMVATLVIPVRALYGLEDFITLKHLDNMAKLMLFTSGIVTYGYLSEWFTAWYSDDVFEMSLVHEHFHGIYAPIYYVLLFCNCLAPLVFFSRKLRHKPWLIFVISILINVGMYAERFIIVVQSLYHDFLPSSQRVYWPTIWDVGAFVGTLGVFSFLMLLFIRYVPMISICELSKLAVKESHE
jgi:Ni/Fe-hydrogenase subunit HybB-like protein